MQNEGLSFEEARRRVARQIVFTTHTPVPAGHDRFSASQVEEHLGPLRDQLGIARSHLMSLGRVQTHDENEEFCMTVLALKHSRRANAVSSLHGDVSRSMWQTLYPGRSEDEVPIGHITNGIHVPSWLAPQMRQLFERHLGPDWIARSSDPQWWDRVANINNGELWETHQVLKSELLAFVRERLVRQSERRGEVRQGNRRLDRALSLDILTIGFARRFATYKRANLLFRDLHTIASLLNDPQFPLQVVFAGKAHPRDIPGKQVLQEIARFARSPEFQGKIVFVEDYDINVGRHLVQGVDVWLNNPRRPLEASGTSGMKTVLNGGLNLSVLDGWWAEAFHGINGFAIGAGESHVDLAIHDRTDSQALYRVLREEVIPMYYHRDPDGVPTAWVARMKSAIRTLGWRFSADRMVMDYVQHCYVPAAGGLSSDMCRT
jgi:starch phosphorylase